MYKVQFKGRLLPDPVKVTILGGPSLHVENKKIGLITDIRFSIVENTITVDCDVNTLDRSNLSQLIFRVQRAVESATNLLTITTGVGHFAILDKCQLPDGTVQDVFAEDRELAALITSIKSNDDLVEIINMCMRETPLFSAVRDLSDSIKTHGAAEISAARAIETLRNYFIPEGGTRKDGWKSMCEALNVNEEYVRHITDLSRGPRHGDYLEIESQNLREAGIRTWTLMNRFIEHRKRGNRPLPVSDFPRLE
jgi:hypothetical protein